MARTKKKRVPAMDAWLKLLGEELVSRRKPRKQEDFADTIGISRGQLSIIENGGRSYGIEPLLTVLVGLNPERDPHTSLIEITAKLDEVDLEAAEAVGNLVAVLSGTDQERRTTAIRLVRSLRKDQIASRSVDTSKKRKD